MSKTTTDHDEIRRWAEERGGRPATAKGTESGGEPGVLRFDFNEPEDSLEEMSWDDFFDKFEKERLALLYNDAKDESRFFKLVNR